jgi:hypothetical protein
MMVAAKQRPMKNLTTAKVSSDRNTQLVNDRFEPALDVRKVETVWGGGLGSEAMLSEGVDDIEQEVTHFLERLY